MSKRKLRTAMLDEDFIMELRIYAAANGKSMAEMSRELAEIDGGLKRLKDKLRLL